MKAWTMYHKTILENGVRILSEQLENYRSVSLGIWVNTGSRDETESEGGISHFIEHMLFKGTKSRSSLDIAKELDAIGGLSNAFTSKEYTCFHAKFLDKHFTVLAEILSDILLNSIFDPVDMDRERQVILQEISMVEDTPDDFIHVLFNRLSWLNHPLGRSVLGSIDTVSGIDRDKIVRYMKRYYRPERIMVTAAGNIAHEQLVAFFKPLFVFLEAENEEYLKTPPRIQSGVSCVHKDLEQVHICLGGEAPELGSEKRFACALLNTILGGNMSSRLFQEIREKRGLAYNVYSFLSPYIDCGLLGIYVATDPSSINQVLGLIRKEVGEVMKGGISSSDLEAAREHLIGGILIGAESTDSRMMRLAKNEHVFGRYIGYDELVAEFEKVTVDEVVAAARDIFKADCMSLATLGPTKEEDLDLSCLRFPVD